MFSMILTMNYMGALLEYCFNHTISLKSSYLPLCGIFLKHLLDIFQLILLKCIQWCLFVGDSLFQNMRFGCPPWYFPLDSEKETIPTQKCSQFWRKRLHFTFPVLALKSIMNEDYLLLIDKCLKHVIFLWNWS